jgi:hypothetical protein
VRVMFGSERMHVQWTSGRRSERRDRAA